MPDDNCMTISKMKSVPSNEDDTLANDVWSSRFHDSPKKHQIFDDTRKLDFSKTVQATTI